MNNDRRVFRYSRLFTVILVAAALLFGGLLVVFLFQDPEPVLLIVFAVFALASGFYALMSFYNLTLTEEGLETWNFFRRSRMRWEDVAHAEPRPWDSFRLVSRTGDSRLYVSSQLVGYFELIQEMMRRKPDLWGSEQNRSFHASWWMTGFLVVVAAFFLYFAGQSLLTEPDPEWGIAFLGGGLGLILIFAVLRLPRRIRFEGSQLLIQRWIGEDLIRAEDVEYVKVANQSVNGGAYHRLELKTTAGKAFTFNNLKEGLPPLIAAIDQWLKRYHPKARK